MSQILGVGVYTHYIRVVSQTDTGGSSALPVHPYQLNSYARETPCLTNQDKFLRQNTSFTSGLYLDMTLFSNMNQLTHRHSSLSPTQKIMLKNDDKEAL